VGRVPPALIFCKNVIARQYRVRRFDKHGVVGSASREHDDSSISCRRTQRLLPFVTSSDDWIVGFPRPHRNALVWERTFATRHADGSATPPLLLSCEGFGVTWLFYVGLSVRRLTFSWGKHQVNCQFSDNRSRWETIATTITDTKYGRSNLSITVFENRSAIHPTTKVVGFVT